MAAIAAMTVGHDERLRSFPLNSAAAPPGGIPERSKGPDCKSGGYAFEGSNPSPATAVASRGGPPDEGDRLARRRVQRRSTPANHENLERVAKRPALRACDDALSHPEEPAPFKALAGAGP